MALATAGLLLVRVGGLALACAVSDDERRGQLIEGSTFFFFYGILGSQLLTNVLAGVTVKR
jgi:hypothetical protein